MDVELGVWVQGLSDQYSPYVPGNITNLQVRVNLPEDVMLGVKGHFDAWFKTGF